MRSAVEAKTWHDGDLYAWCTPAQQGVLTAFDPLELRALLAGVAYATKRPGLVRIEQGSSERELWISCDGVADMSPLPDALAPISLLTNIELRAVADRLLLALRKGPDA